MPITITETWSNGQTPVFSLDLIQIEIPTGETVAIATGDVTSGEFAGDTIEIVVTYLIDDFLGCLNPKGLSSLEGPATLALTSD